MKPFSSARLAETVARLKDRLRDRPANLEGILSVLATKVRAGEYLRWITASQGNDLNVITVEEVCYFKADNKYTMVITPDGEALIRRPIKELAEVVDPRRLLADPPVDAGQHQRDRRRDARLSAATLPSG